MPIASVLICFYLMLNLSVETWIRFLVWMAIGLAVYFFYGRTHSKVGRQAEVPTATPTR